MDERTIKERLLEFIAYKNLNVSRFEKLCGLSNGYVRSVERGIGCEKLDNIRRKFPELSIAWLTLGEGVMLNNIIMLHEEPTQPQNENQQSMPIISEDIARAEELDVYEHFMQHRDSIERITFSELLPRFDFFYVVTSDALKPNIEKSDILALRKINGSRIVNGECYVIDTKQFGFILRFAYEDEEKVLRLETSVSMCTSQKVSSDDILGVYSIVGLIRPQVTAHSFISVLVNELEKKSSQLDEALSNNKKMLDVVDRLMK